MIGKAKSNKSLLATINYNLKEKAELIFINQLIGEGISDYQIQMQAMQRCYPGLARQLTIHVILSPHISEGKNLTTGQWQKIAEKYLNEMNLIDYQAIGFLHKDKEHRHLHLVINKVKDPKLKLYHDAFIGKRSQKAADKIAQDFGLIRAMEIRQLNNEKRMKQNGRSQNKHGPELETTEKPLGSKQLFRQILNDILDNEKVKSIEDYFKEIEKAGFKIHFYKNKETKELRGYGIEKDNIKMDASTIGREFTLTKLSAKFMENGVRVTEETAIINQKENEYYETRGVNYRRHPNAPPTAKLSL